MRVVTFSERAEPAYVFDNSGFFERYRELQVHWPANSCPKLPVDITLHRSDRSDRDVRCRRRWCGRQSTRRRGRGTHSLRSARLGQERSFTSMVMAGVCSSMAGSSGFYTRPARPRSQPIRPKSR